MITTSLTAEAAHRMRRGGATARREEVISVEGTHHSGEPVQLVDPEGELLGLGDLDLEADVAVRRLGLPDESPEGLIPRHLRRAMNRRAQLVQDPRYCRFVNEDGDGLPGLVVDRFDRHYTIQTTSRAMDARIEEIARLLVEIADGRSVLLRNDTFRRSRAGLSPDRSGHVLHGAPPRWTRLLELNARLSIDLQKGPGTGYNYALRELRRMIARLSPGRVVLDPACLVGGTAVQAGLHGAKRILAFASDADDLELARENLEANGMMSRAAIELAEPLEALRSLEETFDMVVLHAPTRLDESEHWTSEFEELVRHSVHATRHGGFLVLAASGAALGPIELEDFILSACAVEERVAYRLVRAAAPVDFPALVGSPINLFAIAMELS